ncbi:MAG: nitroreductase family protein [Thermoplasmata archaeon]|nr:nitroreductase family protein [Thermoplasmata archaeon]
MSFMELAEERYSSRQYQDRPVEKEKVDAILEAGRIAPTAKNLQPARVIVVDSAEGMAKIAKTARLYGATLALIVVADSERAWVRPFDGKNFGDIDASIVTTQMMYEAQELGLGSVWIGYFDPKLIKEEFGLAESEEASSILAVGYRADETSANHGKRNPMDVFASRFD